MQPYTERSSDLVKSVRQRWLLSYWTRLRGERTLPRWADLDLAELDSCFDDLTILDALAADGRVSFRIFDHGKNVGAMYAGECAGKFLDEVLPAAARDYTLETYEQAVRTRMPVYTVSKVADAGARTVFYERLLLPFGERGDTVFRVIGFLETISPDGGFERQKLMTGPEAAGGFAVKALLNTRVSAIQPRLARTVRS
jgi:hypothetical protein